MAMGNHVEHGTFIFDYTTLPSKEENQDGKMRNSQIIFLRYNQKPNVGYFSSATQILKYYWFCNNMYSGMNVKSFENQFIHYLIVFIFDIFIKKHAMIFLYQHLKVVLEAHSEHEAENVHHLCYFHHLWNFKTKQQLRILH